MKVSSLRRAWRGIGLSSGSRDARPTSRGGAQRRVRRATLAGLVMPSVLVLLTINVYPLIYAVIQSTHNGSLINGGDFVGLDNFITAVMSDSFRQAILFTLIFTVSGVLGSWAVGLALALLLQKRIPGGNIFRVLLLLPWIVPVVVSTTAWNWLLATPQSVVPTVAREIGLGDLQFLASPVLAAIVVCVFKVWVSFPFMMMMSGSALSSIDRAVFEAAEVDGASPYQKLRHITLPLIAPTTFISWILMTIFCINDFGSIFLLTGGGPLNSTTTLTLLAYNRVFRDFRVGSGVAIALMMTAVLAVVSGILYRRIQRVEL
jgi:multiple sugar transport system permease protein